MNDNSGSKKTPNRGWFGKGHCGNPGGRPTASPAPRPSVLEILIDKTLTAVRDGISATPGVPSMNDRHPRLQSRVTSRPIPRTPMSLSCCLGSQRLIWRARNGPRTGSNFSLSPGGFKRPFTADEAANA